MYNQQIANQHTLNDFRNTVTNLDSSRTDSVLPPTYIDAINRIREDKFKDLQSRAISILIDKEPIKIVYKDNPRLFVYETTMADCIESIKKVLFIEELSKYAISDLCHDKVMIFNRQWKNNFLTKTLNVSFLKKYIFRLNAKKFYLSDIKFADNNIKQQIALMLLDEYNAEDRIGLWVAFTSLHIARLIQHTSLTESNQLKILQKFGKQMTQFLHDKLGDQFVANYFETESVIKSFDNKSFALYNKIKKYIKQQKTIELNNDFYMHIFEKYFNDNEIEFLQN